MKKKIKCILLIIGIVGIIVAALAIIDLQKSYELPFEREELDSFSMIYVSSSVTTDTFTYDKEEDCDMIMDFFDSLQPTARPLSGDWKISAYELTFYLKDGTEEQVAFTELEGFHGVEMYSFVDDEGEYIYMSSKMILRNMFQEETSMKILVNGTMYYWDRYKHPPRDYKEYGALEAVNGTPQKDCQIMAKNVTGTIYTSELTPHAIYLEMSIDNKVGFYVRFVTKELAAGPRILWNGIFYSGGNMYDGSYEALGKEELPDTCEYIGNLHVISEDAIPENDLEINLSLDEVNRPLEGREVYFDPNDPGYIYVLKKHGKDGANEFYTKYPALQ